MAKNTVTDEIGDAYKEWRQGDTVFISAPTGSGKTYFVFNTLLPYAKKNKQKILYLVNRSILKEQLEKELSRRSIDDNRIVRIELYQTIENCLCSLYQDKCGFYQPKDGNQPMLQELARGYAYVVCDECHYFLADSNYNTNTWLSFQWVQEYLGKNTRIFLSATLNNIKPHIVMYDEIYKYQKTSIYGFYGNSTYSERVLSKRGSWEYDTDRDYSYLKIETVTKRDKIIDLICEGNEKWLIFVDSISAGKELQKKIQEKLEVQKGEADECDILDDEKVVFLSSGYKKEHGDSLEEVLSIKNTDIQSARILIATSVMDNGINLKDARLKNLVIFADNETEFIQMLGRRRRDGNQVNLYILKRSRGYFSKRLNEIIRLEKIAAEYWEYLSRTINDSIQMATEQEESIDWNRVIQAEMMLVQSESKRLLYRLFNEENMYDKLRAAFYAYNGWLCLNRLSLYQMDCLKSFYDQMLLKFDEEGEDAFIREQLRWLGKQECEIEEIISENRITEEEKSRERVCYCFDSVVEQALDQEEAKKFQEQVRNDLLILIKSCEESPRKKTVENNLRKNRRPLSKPDMEYLSENCGLPYKLETINEKKVFKRIKV